MDKVKVAAAQVAPVFMDKEATIDKACRTIYEAGRAGARLVVLRARPRLLRAKRQKREWNPI